ncbi:uncharacterized protein METZ01_LOCUS273931 [marine metagenome]|uniref:Uncharacterized protein n=1 Tax=marine metagenome TaxID=408172 RepID=A0A382KDJ4_9ZZZZ
MSIFDSENVITTFLKQTLHFLLWIVSASSPSYSSEGSFGYTVYTASLRKFFRRKNALSLIHFLKEQSLGLPVLCVTNTTSQKAISRTA